MAKIVFFGMGASGIINQTLPLVEELVRGGDQIDYYGVSAYREKIERTGATFKRLVMNESENQDWEKVKLVKKDRAFEKKSDLATFSMGYEAAFSRSYPFVKQFFQGLNQANNIDLIIYDSLSLYGKTIAQQLRVPAISSITTFAYCDEIFKLQPRFVLEQILNFKEEYLEDPEGTKKALDKEFFSLARLFGFSGGDFMSIFCCRGELNIVYTSKLFQNFGELFDESFKFVGPSITDEREPMEFPFDRLNGKPLIYISLGTIYNDNLDFFKKCLAAFGKMDEKQFVMSIGKKIEISSLEGIPGNFIVKNTVPQLDILKRASLFITHGGMNSVNEGLYFGVPLILFPQNGDQFLVGKRVEELGAGICIQDSAVTIEELQNAVIRIFASDSFKPNSQTISDSLTKAGGYKKAAAEISIFKEKHGIR